MSKLIATRGKGKQKALTIQSTRFDGSDSDDEMDDGDKKDQRYFPQYAFLAFIPFPDVIFSVDSPKSRVPVEHQLTMQNPNSFLWSKPTLRKH